MGNINIDGTEYDFDALDDEVKANITSLKFVENEINRLKLTEAALETAATAYRARIGVLIAEGDEVSLSDNGSDSGSITFD